MSLVRKLRAWRRRWLGQEPGLLLPERIGSFERLERRQLLAADIYIGAVYLDPNDGTDVVGNTLTITWQGGAPGTQLTELLIETDKLGDGLTIGDTFFDTAPGGNGAFGSHPFQLIQTNGFTVTSVSVADGGMVLRLTFDGFDAGEKLIFKVDVDEMGFLSANAVAEGNEFEGSRFTPTFVAPNYQTATTTDIFLDAFDFKLLPTGLPLPPDSYMPPDTIAQPVYTAGAILKLTQAPLPNSISGHVDYDTDPDCFNGIGEYDLAGVTIELLDANGLVIQTTVTDSHGNYSFDNLLAGTYSVREQQPSAYITGGNNIGTKGGVKHGPNQIDQIVLVSNDHGVNYDFCEKLPVSISGYVDFDTDGDCFNGIGETPLSGVVIQLLDENGAVIGTTTTDNNGYYEFTNLAPGVYQVKEIQPAGYINGGTQVGSAGGSKVKDHIFDINLAGGVHAVHYDFCEIPPAKLSGYVFQDGPTVSVLGNNVNLNQVAADLYASSNGLKTSDDTPISGVTLMLLDASGNPVLDDSGAALVAVTDANGFYQFIWLRAGSYTVVEVQPSGYYDGKDTAGSTGGVALEPGDVIGSIPLVAGQNSVNNNFAELRVQARPFFIPPPESPPPPSPPFISPNPVAPLHPIVPVVQQPVLPFDPPRSGDVVGYTWHLSVINAGRPRTDRAVQFTASVRGLESWTSGDLKQSQWRLSLDRDDLAKAHDCVFGMCHGIPVTGDFNGDGRTDVGVFRDGEWFIDLNGNGVWDGDDLWAKLGYEHDLPVTGDWDGDGKTDIGIYGRAWPGDPRAIAEEPGLPDPDNVNFGKQKNIPRREELAEQRFRTMQLTSSGNVRADIIDHVFNYGHPGDHPIAGDWNGAGVDTIGVFREGSWNLDVDGDGKFSDLDVAFQMGSLGDLPAVGDFDGDGVDEVGLFRDGVWRIDINHDRVLDERDLIVEFGQTDDIPAVGDYNADGVDEVGVYRDCNVEKSPLTAAKP